MPVPSVMEMSLGKYVSHAKVTLGVVFTVLVRAEGGLVLVGADRFGGTV